MKVLGILCSPRKDGNTEILMQEALASAREAGAEAEMFAVRDKDIKPCDACYACAKTGKCHIKDDMQELYLKFLEADGIIWGTPVFFFNVTAQAKIIIDRLYPLYMDGKLVNKVGGVIAVASSLGHSGVLDLFNAIFSASHMFSAGFACGFARRRGGIRKDKHAMKAAEELGRLVVLMLKQQLRYPREYDLSIYRFVSRKYGIDLCPSMGRFEE